MNRVIGPRIYSDGTIINDPSEVLNDFVIVDEVDTVQENALSKKATNSYLESSISVSTSAKTEESVSTASSTNWFSNFFSWFNFNYNTADHTEASPSESLKLPSSPTLEQPSHISQDKNTQALLSLAKRFNQNKQDQLDDDLDQDININSDSEMLRALFRAHLRARANKQDQAIFDGEDLLKLQKSKKTLHLEQLSHKTDVVGNMKTQKVLGWVNWAATTGICGLTVMSLFSSSGAITAAVVMIPSAPIAGALATITAIGTALANSFTVSNAVLAVVQGGSSGVGAYTQYKTDQLSGKIFLLTVQSKKMDVTMQDTIDNMQQLDKEMLDMLHTIRQLLDNHNEAVKAFIRK